MSFPFMTPRWVLLVLVFTIPQPDQSERHLFFHSIPQLLSLQHLTHQTHIQSEQASL